MCKLKIGDTVIISNNNLNKSDLELETPYVIARITDNNVFLKVNESTIVGVSCDEVKKINPEYLKSNRYELAKAVKGSNHPATELSLALGHSMYYFGGETKESRFNSHGDFSEGRLIVLLGKLLEAEKLLSEKEETNRILDEMEQEFQPTGYETPEDFNQDLKVTPEEVQEVKQSIEQHVSKETDAEIEEKAERKGVFILMSVIIILILIFTYLAFK